MIHAAHDRIRNVFGAVRAVGGQSLVAGAWVAPTLFAQSDRHLAGVLAARLFGIETYLGLAVAATRACVAGPRKIHAGLSRRGAAGDQ